VNCATNQYRNSLIRLENLFFLVKAYIDGYSSGRNQTLRFTTDTSSVNEPDVKAISITPNSAEDIIAVILKPSDFFFAKYVTKSK